MKREFNSFVGEAFEDIAGELLLELNKSGRLPFSFSKLGRWWYREEEIDLVALNEETREIAFFEVKWSEVSKKDTDRILADLKRKASLVKWHNDEREEHFGLIAKAMAGKKNP